MAVTNDNGGISAKITAATDAIAGRIRIRKILWAGGTTAGDAIAIKDTTKDKVILEATLDAADKTVPLDFDPPLEIAGGLTVSTLGSGYLYIFFA